jgi:hypothetical protein
MGRDASAERIVYVVYLLVQLLYIKVTFLKLLHVMVLLVAELLLRWSRRTNRVGESANNDPALSESTWLIQFISRGLLGCMLI